MLWASWRRLGEPCAPARKNNDWIVGGLKLAAPHALHLPSFVKAEEARILRHGPQHQTLSHVMMVDPDVLYLDSKPSIQTWPFTKVAKVENPYET